MVRVVSVVVAVLAACGGKDDQRPPRQAPADQGVRELLMQLETMRRDHPELTGSHSAEWDVRDAEDKLAAAKTAQERLAAQAVLDETRRRARVEVARVRPDLDEALRQLEDARAARANAGPSP
jgi:hypothetical protein